jgi:hypothetical protein
MKDKLRSFAIAIFALMGVVTPTVAQSGYEVFPHNERDDRFPRYVTCLSDYGVRQEIAALGYSQIYLNIMGDSRVQVRATMGKWVYLIDFNYCTRRVEGRTRLRPAQ